MAETDWQVVRRTIKTWDVFIWSDFEISTNHVSEWEIFGRIVLDQANDLYHVDIVEWQEEGHKWHRTERRYQTYRAALNAVVSWRNRAS